MATSAFHMQMQGMAMVGSYLNKKIQLNIHLSSILNVYGYGYGNWCAFSNACGRK
jgi:hypothetical protein